MADFKRVRPGSISLNVGDRILIADKTVDFERYAQLLQSEWQIVLNRITVRKSVTYKLIRQAAKAIACGRIVASNKASPSLYERSAKCRNSQLCTKCHFSLRRKQAENQLSDVEKCIGKTLLGFVFTLHIPNSAAEASKLTKLAGHTAIKALMASIAKWKLDKRIAHRVGHYALGLHMKKTRNSDYLWPHLHLAILVDSMCPLNGDESFIDYIKDAFHSAVQLSPAPKVLWQSYGKLSYSTQSAATRKQQRKGPICSVEHATRLFAYVTRNTERDDTPDSVGQRDRTLQNAEIVNTIRRSRRRATVGQLKSSSIADKFHPEILNKAKAYIFPIDGTEHRQLAMNSFYEEWDELIESAERDLNALLQKSDMRRKL